MRFLWLSVGTALLLWWVLCWKIAIQNSLGDHSELLKFFFIKNVGKKKNSHNFAELSLFNRWVWKSRYLRGLRFRIHDGLRSRSQKHNWRENRMRQQIKETNNSECIMSLQVCQKRVSDQPHVFRSSFPILTCLHENCKFDRRELEQNTELREQNFEMYDNRPDQEPLFVARLSHFSCSFFFLDEEPLFAQLSRTSQDGVSQKCFTGFNQKKICVRGVNQHRDSVPKIRRT